MSISRYLVTTQKGVVVYDPEPVFWPYSSIFSIASDNVSIEDLVQRRQVELLSGPVLHVPPLLNQPPSPGLGPVGPPGPTGPAGPPGSITIPAKHTVHVDKDGSNITGIRESISLPFVTITAALLVAVSGDTLVVHPGVYVEDLTLIDGITVLGYDREGCIIDGDVSWSPSTAGDEFLGLQNISITGTFAIDSSTKADPGTVTCEAVNTYAFAFTGNGRPGEFDVLRLSDSHLYGTIVDPDHFWGMNISNFKFLAHDSDVGGYEDTIIVGSGSTLVTRYCTVNGDGITASGTGGLYSIHTYFYCDVLVNTPNLNYYTASARFCTFAGDLSVGTGAPNPYDARDCELIGDSGANGTGTLITGMSLPISGSDPSAISGIGNIYTKLNTGVAQLYYESDTGVITQLTPVVSGTTLDGSYDFGGAGAGRSIIVDANAVQLTGNAADNNNILEIQKVPVGSQSGNGLDVLLGANTTGTGIYVQNNGSGDAGYFGGDVHVTGKLTVDGLIDPLGLILSGSDPHVTCADSTNLRIGGTSVISDIAPGNTLLVGQSPLPGASSNKTGGHVAVSGGPGIRSVTIGDYTALSGVSLYLIVNGIMSTLTEGAGGSLGWIAATSNNNTATSLATAISNVSGLSAVATSNIIKITKADTVYSLSGLTPFSGGTQFVVSFDYQMPYVTASPPVGWNSSTVEGKLLVNGLGGLTRIETAPADWNFAYGPGRIRISPGISDANANTLSGGYGSSAGIQLWPSNDTFTDVSYEMALFQFATNEVDLTTWANGAGRNLQCLVLGTGQATNGASGAGGHVYINTQGNSRWKFDASSGDLIQQGSSKIQVNNISNLSGTMSIFTGDASSLLLKTNNTTAVTFDTSQNSTFAGNVILGSSKRVQSNDYANVSGTLNLHTIDSSAITIKTNDTLAITIDTSQSVNINSGKITSPGAGANSEQFGSGAVASGNHGMAIGYGTTASAPDTIAIGYTAQALSDQAIAIGSQSIANGTLAGFLMTAIGIFAQAGPDIGTSITSTGIADCIAIGDGAISGRGDGTGDMSDLIAIGDVAVAGSNNASDSGNYYTCISIGSFSVAGDQTRGGSDLIAIGDSAAAQGDVDCISLGDNSLAGSTSGDEDCIAIGDFAQAHDGRDIIAIGKSAIGRNANDIIVIGDSINANGVTDTVVIGDANSVAGTNDQISIGDVNKSGIDSTDHDCISIGNNVQVRGSNSIGIGHSQVIGGDSDSADNIGLGHSAAVSGIQGIAIGASATVGSDDDQQSCIAIGNAAQATGTAADSNIAIGNAAHAHGASDNISIGDSSLAGSTTDSDCIAIGTSSQATTGNNLVAIGASASASGTYGVAIGTSTGASTNCVSVGHSTTTGVQYSIGIGYSNNVNTFSDGRDLIVIGRSCAIAANGVGPTGGCTNVILMGKEPTNVTGSNVALSNVFVAGGTDPITDVFFGSGPTGITGTPVAYTIHGSPGAITGGGADGADIYIAGGLGATSGDNGGSVKLQAASWEDGTVLIDRYIIAANATVLTKGSATSIFDISLPTNTMSGGIFKFTIRSRTASAVQCLTNIATWSAVNQGGSYTTQITLDTANKSEAASSGTITLTSVAFTTGTNKVTLQINATTSLTPTEFDVIYTIDNESGRAITLL